MDRSGIYFYEVEHDAPNPVRDFPFHLAHAFAWARREYAKRVAGENCDYCHWSGMTLQELRGPDPATHYLYVAQEMLDKAEGDTVPVRDERMQSVHMSRKEFARHLIERAHHHGLEWTSARETWKRRVEGDRVEFHPPPRPKQPARLSDEELNQRLSDLGPLAVPLAPTLPEPAPTQAKPAAPDPSGFDLLEEIRRKALAQLRGEAPEGN